jgi:hypothetical protein
VQGCGRRGKAAPRLAGESVGKGGVAWGERTRRGELGLPNTYTEKQAGRQISGADPILCIRFALVFSRSTKACRFGQGDERTWTDDDHCT